MTLERFKLIRSKRIGKTLHFFISDIPEDLDKFKVIFLNPVIPKILEQFFKEDTIKISKLAVNLDFYPGTIQYHVNKLKELNIIKTTKSVIQRNLNMHLMFLKRI